MSNRSKEALIARHEIKKRQKEQRTPFSLTKFPSGAAFTNMALFGILAIAFIALPVVLPDFGKALYRQKAISSVRDLELTNDVFPGQFKRTPHSGDTTPDDTAMFMAVSILKHADIGLQNENAARTYVDNAHKAQFNNNTKEIYEGIVLMKSLGLFGSEQAEQIKDGYFELLLSLTERHSSFSIDSGHSSSVDATYFAFEAIKALGKFEEFKKREEFNSAIRFVSSMKDANSQGFRNVAGNNASLVATWYAVQVLTTKDVSNPTVADALQGVEQYVFNCQAKDGGFVNQPIESFDDRYYTKSSSSSTAQALFILEALRSLDLISLSLTSSNSAAYYEAINYMRACLSLRKGVVGEFPSEETSLEGTFYFLRLIGRFPGVTYGTPRGLQLLSVGIGVLLLVAAAYNFVRAQVSVTATRDLVKVLKRSAVLLSVAAGAMCSYPQVSIVVYLIFVVYLGTLMYKIVTRESQYDFMILTVSVHTLVSVGFAYVLLTVSPVVFANVQVFYALVIWTATSALVVTISSSYLIGTIKRTRFYVNCGFLGWILSTVLLYSLIYGRGEMEVIYRMIVIHGHFPLVFVVLPLVSLAVCYGLSGYGAHIYFSYYDETTKVDTPADSDSDSDSDADDDTDSDSDSDNENDNVD